MTCAPQRRWFRFSLRTLFVVMTVAGFGSWIGNQLNWIRQRHEFLSMGLKQSMSAIDDNRFLIDLNRLPGDGGFRLAPGVLFLFGERGIKNLNLGVPKKRFLQPRPNPASYYLPESDSYLQRARELFPESDLFFFPYAERD
jgi:hypothetical protein